MKTLKLLFAAATVLSICSTCVGQKAELRLMAKVRQAVAVAGSPQIGYYILTSEDVIYRYMPSGSGLQFSYRFPLQTPGNGVDLTLAHASDGGDSLAVTQWNSKLKTGTVSRYSLDGKLLQTWNTRHTPTGVVFDPAKQVIYFATLDSDELYRVSLRAENPEYVCEVYGAMQLGAAALDSGRQIVYVADGQGSIFVIDLRSRRSRRLGPSFGLATALWYDESRQVLYVSDGLAKRIYAVNTRSPGSQTTPVVRGSGQLSSPAGLAPGPEGTLLIVDWKADSVFLAQGASDGEKLEQRRPQSR